MSEIAFDAPCVLELADARAADVTRSGGKGASLARLARAGFAVPDGAVITTAAYRRWSAAAADPIAAVSVLDGRDHAAVARASELIVSGLRRIPLPSVVVEELTAALDLRCAGAWAVRSSATLEDLAVAAFAGQHDTYLNCVGVDEVLERVRDCWCSLWSPRAIAYRATRGLARETVAMAVVVQRLIECDAAGVAFSVDPVHGQLGHVVVDANLGLGESVVGGEAPVDHYVVARTGLTVVERRVARKSVRVIAGSRGTSVVELAPAAAEASTLDDSQAAAVARLALSVESHHGWPQDVEWGIAEGQLYLLQARPVTAIAPRWTRDESAERFPNPVTPLTWDFVEDGFHRSLEHSLALMGLPPHDGRWFACFGHYVYGNQNAVELYARRSPLAGVESADLPGQVAELLPKLEWLFRLPEEWHRALPGHLAAIHALGDEPLDAYTLPELWDYVERVNAVGTAYFLPNIAISLGHGLLHGALHAVVHSAVGDDDASTLVSALVACETMTTRVNAELAALAELARRCGVADAIVSTDRSVLWQAHRDDPREPWRGLRRFLAEHGHRETDFDAYHPTWRDAPWVVLEHVRALLLAPPREATRAPAVEEALDGVPAALRPIAARLAALARTYTMLDDLEHYHTTRLSRPMRRGVTAIGERLVARGILDDALDPFFATRRSLATAIAAGDPTSWDVLAGEVRAARGSWLTARDSVPPWSLDAVRPALRRDEAERVDGDDEAELAGIAGSAGCADGIVHIVRGVEDFAGFAPGSVLVARTTNPAWTPLFHSAAAVITESGGPLSHGAVTAREMRIPAVMSVRGATSLLVNGDRVVVDGRAGTVRIVARR